MPIPATENLNIPTQDILSWSFDNPPYNQDKPIYVDALDPSKSLSCRQAKCLIRKLIAGFRRAGLKAGDCVCIHSFNHLFYPIIVLAIVGARGVFTGTNPAYTPHELAHHISLTHTKFLIVDLELLDPILAAVKKHDIPKSNIFIFSKENEATKSGFPLWKALLDAGEEDWIRFDDIETSKTTTAMLLSTSGTTGLPKAAMLSHYNLIAQHTLVFENSPAKHDIRRLVALPMFHAAMVPSCHTSPLRSGHVTYILRRFEVEEYLVAIEKYQITDVLMVPPVVVRILMSPLRLKYSLESIQLGLVGAAPLDAATQRRFKALLKDDTPFTQGMQSNHKYVHQTKVQVWGMTESSCIMTMTQYPEHDDTGSVGRMLPNCDLKFVDDDGREILTPNPRGEMCVRGPGIIRGYYQNPEANASSFDADGFYHSGDVGYLDSKTGKLYIVDRKKELIKVRGFQVAPGEIEGVLLSHPKVVDAAVIGLNDPSNLEAELPRAYIVLRPGEQMTEAEAVDFAGGQLAKYKRLEGGVKFVDVIPKTASGKILKRVLREDAKKERGAKL